MNESNNTSEAKWRVSVATYNRVVFPHPQNGTWMLALERKATWKKGTEQVQVRSHPFGGAVRLLQPVSLQDIVGEIQFDGGPSQRERDFRIMISPSQWEAVRQYCLDHLVNQDDLELETLPDRELTEEFADTIGVDLTPGLYQFRPLGFVVEDNPVPTDHAGAEGRLTVRVYRIFEVRITEAALCEKMFAASQQHSDQDLGKLAIEDSHNGGRGRANSLLALPLSRVAQFYLSLAPEARYRKHIVDGHELDESVLAVLSEVDVPQYERI